MNDGKPCVEISGYYLDNYVVISDTELDEENKCVKVYLEMLDEGSVDIYLYMYFDGSCFSSTLPLAERCFIYTFFKLDIQKPLNYNTAMKELASSVVNKGEYDDGYNAFYYTDSSFITMISVDSSSSTSFSLASLSTSDNGSQVFISIEISSSNVATLVYQYTYNNYKSVGTLNFYKADVSTSVTSVSFTTYQGSLQDSDSKLCASMLKLSLLALNAWATNNISSTYPKGIAYYLGFTSFVA